LTARVWAEGSVSGGADVTDNLWGARWSKLFPFLFLI
jgi:hypothetical protein